MKFEEIGPAASEKTFKDYTILNMFIAQGQGQIWGTKFLL